MKHRVLEWLVCADCGSDLRLEVFREESRAVPQPEASAVASEADSRDIVEGVLACGCGRIYPIIDGIPRLLRGAPREFPDFFARHHSTLVALAAAGATPPPPEPDRRSARSFGLQWSIYQDGDRTWFKDDLGLRRAEVLFNLQASPEWLRGRTLLDAGCGNGELTRAIASYGMEVVAMDLSRSVEGARRRLMTRDPGHAAHVHHVQADVLAPPFRRGSFDVVHSSGVLHHTPSTQRAFRAIAPLVEPDGRLYVQLYRRREPLIHYLNLGLRSVTTRLPLELLYGLCYATVPVHAGISRIVHRVRHEPPPPVCSRREWAVQMFDNFSPTYQHRHRVEEIVELFRQCGYGDVQDVTLENESRHMLALLGQRTGVGESTGKAALRRAS